MKPGIKAIFIHFFAIVFFVLAALAYFYPTLQGKTIMQSDIVQFTGMAKEQNDFRKQTDSEPYWTNSAFGGMPTYQLGAYYPHNYVKKLDNIIRFLPRPADYLFLYLLGFYILLCCMKVDYRLAVLGALAFGFSTYMIIILGVGHNAKAHAIGYLPILLGGILLTFQKKYLWGFALTAIAMALEVGANHYQMTYYFMLLVLVLGAAYLVDAIRKKVLKHYFISLGILVIAVVLGIAVNATSLLATKEYADWSTRGTSELTINPDGSKKENRDGLDKAYITQYSYGIVESLNLFVPRLFGGASLENLGDNSKAYDYLTEQGISRSKALEFAQDIPLYWGKQPGVSGPAYLGAVVFFLFILGLFLVKGRLKWWLFGGFLISLVLSWGKNFSLLTDFMIDYFPLYDKFRAVSSIQVILELCAPILAVMALVYLINSQEATTRKIKAFKIAFFTVLGLGILLFLIKGMFTFSGLNDDTYLRYYGNEILTMIKLDREAAYTSDLIRSLIFVILAGGALWLYLKGRLRPNILIISLGLLIVIDLVGVDLRYVNKDDFVRQRLMNEPFQKAEFDKQILSEDGIFRIYNQSEGLNGARTSYFHQSIGGYHAAKPAGIQDLFDYHIQQGNLGVLNMMNVKYVIQQDQEGRSYAGLNPNALGNAWFVERLVEVNNADDEIKALEDLDLSKEAVVNTAKVSHINRNTFSVDSTATITLEEYKPNHLIYSSTNDNAGIAVFSEMYYPHGWNVYLDGQPSDHFKLNYTLRGMRVPAGRHRIEFMFEPEVVETGSSIALGSTLLLVIIIIGAIAFNTWRSRYKAKAQASPQKIRNNE